MSKASAFEFVAQADANADGRIDLYEWLTVDLDPGGEAMDWAAWLGGGGYDADGDGRLDREVSRRHPGCPSLRRARACGAKCGRAPRTLSARALLPVDYGAVKRATTGSYVRRRTGPAPVLR